MTVVLRNVGSTSVAFTAYYVKDSYGSNNVYSNTGWSPPSFQPNTTLSVNILIDGRAFTFQARNAYTLTIITTRNSQFTFTITT
jgi:hypothetical protein